MRFVSFNVLKFLKGDTMMYKGKKGKYVAAGVQKSPSILIDVRGNVHLPDSEAGASWYDPGQKPYYAETVHRPKRGPLTVSMNSALIFLCVLFVVFGTMVVSRVARKSAIAKDITAMEQAIQETKKSNSDLELELAEARDIARISYAAKHHLYMVDASSAKTIAVHAPDTRPFENETATYSGAKTGSR